MGDDWDEVDGFEPMECDECQGNGRVYNYDGGTECPSCKGTGVLR